jgi:hypothetical protein
MPTDLSTSHDNYPAVRSLPLLLARCYNDVMPYRILLLFYCCLIIGCGSAKPYDVDAVVTLDGKPFAGADVSLVSLWDKTPSAVGTTDSEGKVTFQTGEVEGVLSGTYTVIVSKIVEERMLSNNEIRALAEVGIRYKAQMIELSPEKYTQRETSDLKMKVGYWSHKEFTFDLRSDKR